jgi:hypothetical protein
MPEGKKYGHIDRLYNLAGHFFSATLTYATRKREAQLK